VLADAQPTDATPAPPAHGGDDDDDGCGCRSSKPASLRPRASSPSRSPPSCVAAAAARADSLAVVSKTTRVVFE
jgi:hypothetical protein